MITKYTRIRIFLVGIFFTVALLTISAKALYLQIHEGQWLSQNCRNGNCSVRGYRDALV